MARRQQCPSDGTPIIDIADAPEAEDAGPAQPPGPSDGGDDDAVNKGDSAPKGCPTPK